MVLEPSNRQQWQLQRKGSRQSRVRAFRHHRAERRRPGTPAHPPRPKSAFAALCQSLRSGYFSAWFMCLFCDNCADVLRSRPHRPEESLLSYGLPLLVLY
ncbi:hypothetical protein BDV29DRAFT_180035 [Aspergillus leporis]|uniref:Uncharacterized protein n=1 Tax=Aspergillus leporis TaxID=41062 RepID=A0A5N5WT69_9EURO|nr:hypothetical protein BDV29DRAFT_180035 [Aspergillus leporis]